jgi:cytochrome c-type biogenesis protein CcmF
MGHLFTLLAILFSLLQATVPMIGAARARTGWMQAGSVFATATFLCVLSAFFFLLRGHVGDDFGMLNVVQNSHSAKPLLYKVSGAWASHEGSMLLWVLILTLFGALIGRSADMPLPLRARALAVQGMTGLAFLLFIILTSDPFLSVIPPLSEGNDLNPLLQDPGLALHPPGLYMGYVGFSSAFAIAAAMLMTRGLTAAWAQWLRPWVLSSWAFLTVGIAAGSWWAYYELGWGGWWFWDPVENAALMPWLAGTALLHSLITSMRRGALLRWTLLLSVLTFSLSLLGTFLVRSGVLTSVHSFAVDPERGVFILVILAVATGGGLSLYAARAPKIPAGKPFAPLSREGAMLLNNLFMCCACASLLLGTLYPIVLQATGGGLISVGAPYFNATVAPLLLPSVFFMGAGPLLRWRRDDWATVARAARLAAVLGFGAVAVGLYVFGAHRVMGLVALGVGAWAIGLTVEDIRATRLSWAANLPRWLAHGGAAISLIGMAGSTFDQEYAFVMRLHDRTQVAGYELSFDDIRELNGPNYMIRRGVFTVTGQGVQTTLFPEWRYYPVQRMPLSHVALQLGPLRDLYLALGDEQDEGGFAVRFQIHPLAPWIWGGGLIAALGGFAGVALRWRRPGKERHER